ncbi:MAG: hypothetical protein AAB501_01375 [Patescibacteria group bacterium]
MVITFYPHEKHKVSENILSFANKFKEALKNIGVTIIPYEESLVEVPIKRKLKILFYSIIGKIPKGLKKGKKIKRGVSVITLGEGITGDLAMDNTLGFAQNSVITILDMPEGIGHDTEFHEHFNTAMNLFAYHMTNIAIVIDKEKWIPYNFNASHPIYLIDENLEKNILKGVIPKIAAPIKPPKLSEFKILKEKFDPFDKEHKHITDDFTESGSMLEKTNLYPPGKLLDSLPFRNDFYKWIGKIHLDHRNGMSYGFLARQLPTKLGSVYDSISFKNKFSKNIENFNDFFSHDNENYIIIDTAKGKICIQITPIWVLAQKSGSKKTNINPERDLIKIGLVEGKMLIQIPKRLKITPDYKPSFDTKVILAHAIGNAIIASLIRHFDPNSKFVDNVEERGLAIAHWHGYINPEMIPDGWSVYGENNVPVSCSTPQSAIFALSGKLNKFLEIFNNNKKYRGDIHIEPHHGNNICFDSLKELGQFLSKENTSRLGNHFLNFYKQ